MIYDEPDDEYENGMWENYGVEETIKVYAWCMNGVYGCCMTGPSSTT